MFPSSVVIGGEVCSLNSMPAQKLHDFVACKALQLPHAEKACSPVPVSFRDGKESRPMGLASALLNRIMFPQEVCA